jgi:hypothetical protein
MNEIALGRDESCGFLKTVMNLAFYKILRVSKLAKESRAIMEQ